MIRKPTRREILKYGTIALGTLAAPFLFPPLADAAFDSAVDGGDNGSGSNNLTFAFNNAGGNILFVGFSGASGGTSDDVTSVTYNGVGCTLVNKIVNGNTADNLYLYLLVSPATGSHNIVITCSSTHWLRAGAVSYSGAATSGQPDAQTTNAPGGNASTLSTSLTSVANNCWHMLVEVGFDNDNPPGAGSGTTRRAYNAASGVWGIFDSNSAKTPAGSVTLTTTYPSATTSIGHVMTSFAPSVATGVIRHQVRMMGD